MNHGFITSTLDALTSSSLGSNAANAWHGPYMVYTEQDATTSTANTSYKSSREGDAARVRQRPDCLACWHSLLEPTDQKFWECRDLRLLPLAGHSYGKVTNGERAWVKRNTMTGWAWWSSWPEKPPALTSAASVFTQRPWRRHGQELACQRTERVPSIDEWIRSAFTRASSLAALCLPCHKLARSVSGQVTSLSYSTATSASSSCKIRTSSSPARTAGLDRFSLAAKSRASPGERIFISAHIPVTLHWQFLLMVDIIVAVKRRVFIEQQQTGRYP